MESVATTLTSIWAMLSSAFEFITGNPWMLMFVALPVVGGILGILFSIFHRR